MKKFSMLISPILFLSMATPVLADVLDAGVKAAHGTINADTSVGSLITFFVAFVIVLATLLALVMIVIGAIQWITSGGDKTKVDAARNHIIAAIIGLVVIALSFVIINVVISALGLGDLMHLRIPKLTDISGQANP